MSPNPKRMIWVNLNADRRHELPNLISIIN
jgi:hypothetical protein